jgi:hypothetical protein
MEHSLKQLGCELRSAVRHERARDADGKLTRFLTGKRFVFITTPSVPLEKNMTVSFFTASIYHREQKTVQKKIVCSKCLENGHHMSVCKNDVVCRTCKKTGHKRGDPVCDLGGDRDSDNNNSADKTLSVGQTSEQNNYNSASHPILTSTLSLSSDNSQNTTTTTTITGHHSRTKTRNITPRSQSLDVRVRSESAKRKRSNNNDSPKGPSDKQQRQLEHWLTNTDNETNDSQLSGWG